MGYKRPTMNTSRLLPLLRRSLHTSTRRNIKDVEVDIPAGYAKLKEKQKMFQIDNGLRVHERGGAMDKVLYNLTTVMVVVGGIMWARQVYAMAFPPKN